MNYGINCCPQSMANTRNSHAVSGHFHILVQKHRNIKSENLHPSIKTTIHPPEEDGSGWIVVLMDGLLVPLVLATN